MERGSYVFTEFKNNQTGDDNPNAEESELNDLLGVQNVCRQTNLLGMNHKKKNVTRSLWPTEHPPQKYSCNQYSTVFATVMRALLKPIRGAKGDPETCASHRYATFRRSSTILRTAGAGRQIQR